MPNMSPIQYTPRRAAIITFQEIGGQASKEQIVNHFKENNFFIRSNASEVFSEVLKMVDEKLVTVKVVKGEAYYVPSLQIIQPIRA